MPIGDDNHAAIDAQLEVLEKRMTMAAVYERWGNEGSDEFDQHVLDLAIEAQDWMSGIRASDEPSPAAGCH